MKVYYYFIISLFVTLVFSLPAFSQFNGGNSDGQDKSGSIQSTLNGVQVNSAPLYFGGFGDGHSKEFFQGTLAGSSSASLFSGGRGDGADKSAFNGVIDGTSLAGLYDGGTGDGFDKARFDGLIDGTSLTGLYGGGFGDGFDKSRFDGLLDGSSLAALYGGGFGDGFDKSRFDGLIDGTSLAGLFGGGTGDGFDKSRFDGVIDGTSLTGLYGGGAGDGFDKAPYNGPLTIDPPDPPLPVELLFFTAFTEGEDVRIQWETTLEINNDYFVVQRSNNTIDATDLFEVAALGNESGARYSELDTDPLPGTSYYRLKQVDLDGTFTLTDWVAINFDKKEDIPLSLFPNPSPDGLSTLVITLPIPSETVDIRVFNVWGQLLLERSHQTNGNLTLEIPIELSRWVPGSYPVQVLSGDYQGSINWLVLKP